MGLFSGLKQKATDFKQKAANFFTLPIEMIQEDYKKLVEGDQKNDGFKERYSREFTPNPQYTYLGNINKGVLRQIKELSDKCCDYDVEGGNKLSEEQKTELKGKFEENQISAEIQIDIFREPFKGRNNFNLKEHRCKVIGSWFAVYENCKQNYDLLREAWGIKDNELQIDPRLNIEPEVLENELKAMSELKPVKYSLESSKKGLEEIFKGFEVDGEILKQKLGGFFPPTKEELGYLKESVRQGIEKSFSLLEKQLGQEDVMLPEEYLGYMKQGLTNGMDDICSQVKNNLEQALYFRLLSCNNLTEVNDAFQQHKVMNEAFNRNYGQTSKELSAIRREKNNAKEGVNVEEGTFRGEAYRKLVICDMITTTELVTISERMSDKVADFKNTSNKIATLAVGLVQDKELKDRCADGRFENILNEALNKETKQTTDRLPLEKIEEEISRDNGASTTGGDKAVQTGSMEQTENNERKGRDDKGEKEH